MREGVGEGEREEEREGDMLRGLSPQTKNAGYVTDKIGQYSNIFLLLYYVLSRL